MSLQRCLLADGTEGFKWDNSGFGRTTKLEALRDGVAALTKSNENHDDKGQFSSSGGAGGVKAAERYRAGDTLTADDLHAGVQVFIDSKNGNRSRDPWVTVQSVESRAGVTTVHSKEGNRYSLRSGDRFSVLGNKPVKSESSENLSKGDLPMSGFRIFAQIQKVDAEKRLVFGRAAEEVVDKDNEVFDYKSSKPLFQKWSAEISADTDGKSLGNVRAMHGKIAAGKVTEIDFNDAAKAIDVCAKVVDENEWNKVLEGVYTGFSIGGRYVGEKTTEKMDGKDVNRYTAEPSEISLVDRPCIPTAKFFNVVKQVGGREVQLMKVAFVEKQFEDARANINESVTVSAQSAPVNVAASGPKGGNAASATDNASHSTTAAVNNNVTETQNAEDPKRKDKKKDKGALATDGSEDYPVTVAAKETDKADAPEYPVVGSADDIEALAKLMNEAKLSAGVVLKIVQDAVTFQRADDIRVQMAPMTAEELAKYTETNKDTISHIEIIEKREFSADERKAAADKGQAMPDGSFPIANKKDLSNAVQAHGRAKDTAAAKTHIIARARALGATDALPEDWKSDKMFDAANVQKKMKDGLVKGLYDVAQLVSIVQALYSVCQNSWYEKSAEGDDSMVPDALKKNVSDLVSTLRSMVDEETSELLSAIDPAEKVDAMSLFTRLAKIGARNSRQDMGRIQKVHDIACDLGAGCGGASSDKLAEEKSALGLDKASGNAFEKTVLSAVEKLVKPMQEALVKAEARVKVLEDQPAPSMAVLKAVGKGQDLGSGDTKIGAVAVAEVAPVIKGGETDIAATAIKKLHAQGGKSINTIGN